MSITLYSHYRRKNLRNAWSLANMNNTVAYVAAGLLALFAAYALVQWLDDSLEQAENKGRQYGAEERKALEQDAKVLAHVLNGKPIRNTETGVVFFVEVSRLDRDVRRSCDGRSDDQLLALRAPCCEIHPAAS